MRLAPRALLLSALLLDLLAALFGLALALALGSGSGSGSGLGSDLGLGLGLGLVLVCDVVAGGVGRDAVRVHACR